jgi:Na+-translocating ferredoxin:NAD+ oxidoreductase RnfD subunit
MSEKIIENKRKSNFFKSPKGYILIVLLVLAAVASVDSLSNQGLINTGISVLTSCMVDLIILLMQKRKRLLPDGALLTGLIIGLILSPTVPWYAVIAASVIAIGSKHILKIRKKPIFNPAAFGLLAVLFLFSSGHAWWGALPDLPVWFVVIVIVGGFLVTHRVNKFPLVLTFLGVYFSSFLVVSLFSTVDVSEVFLTPFAQSALFLSFFMMTDPPTSPAKYGEQMIFGIIAAGVCVVWNIEIGGLSFLLAGLLAANLWHAFLSVVKRAKNKKTETSP